MITDETVEAAVEFIKNNASHYAKAKGERVYLDQFRKTKKALLMAECEEKTQAAKETYAYAHFDYEQILKGLREAVVNEETLKWKMIAAQTKVEIWRTQQATNRNQDRSMR